MPIWDAIFRHRFLEELKDGILPLEKFRYYLIQDYLYLEGFAQTVAIALSKAPDTYSLDLLSRRVATPVERPLHVKLFQLLEIRETQAAQTEPSPTTFAYVNHMASTASLGGIGEAAAALLPCPWTYHEIGARLGYIDHPIYREWVSGYSTGFLQESVAAWREMVDRFGQEAGDSTRQRMRQAFIVSSRYEYLFWDAAYNQVKWPI